MAFRTTTIQSSSAEIQDAVKQRRGKVTVKGKSNITGNLGCATTCEERCACYHCQYPIDKSLASRLTLKSLPMAIKCDATSSQLKRERGDRETYDAGDPENATMFMTLKRKKMAIVGRLQCNDDGFLVRGVACGH